MFRVQTAQLPTEPRRQSYRTVIIRRHQFPATRCNRRCSCVLRHIRDFVLVLALVIPGTASSATFETGAKLDCSEPSLPDDASAEALSVSAMAMRCCEAQKAWQAVEERGGCGGFGTSSSQEDAECALAESLCYECQAFLLLGTSGSNKSSGNNTDSVLDVDSGVSGGSATKAFTLMDAAGGSTNGTSLSSLFPEALQMKCALPHPGSTCNGVLADLGSGLVILASCLLLGFVLMIIWVFDRHGLPRLQAGCHRLRYDRCASCRSRSRYVTTAKTGSDICEGRGPGASAVHALRAAAGNSDTAPHMADVSFADFAPPLESHTAAPETTEPEVYGMPTPLKASACAVEGAAYVVGNVPTWAPRLRALWASRLVFLWVAAVAVTARLAYVCACTVADGRRSLLVVGIEALTCALPYVWCVFTSRPPARPVPGAADRLAYYCTCRPLPRFTTFALAAGAAEVYSNVVAAWALVTVDCSEAPWRAVVPYCIGIAVTVLRVYSALLALRLQEHAVGVCCQVMPSCLDEAEQVKDSDAGVVAGAVAGADGVVFGIATQPDAIESLEAGGSTPQGQRGPLGLYAQNGWQAPVKVRRPPRNKATGFASLHRCLGCRRRQPATDAHASFEDVDEVQELPPMEDGADSTFDEKETVMSFWGRLIRCKVHVWTSRQKLLLHAGLVLVIASAIASVFIIKAILSEAPPENLPSSCVTAQNGTATCQAFQMFGLNLWETGAPEPLMGAANTIEDCCRGCDELEGCQAWIFESMARRCRWIEFTASPCDENPGDLSCRCLSHPGMTFGFKPNSPIIWLQRDASLTNR